MTSIDKSIPIPLYYQLKQVLKERVEDGVYPKGDPIPSELNLMTEFALSRTTVRQAINELVNEKVLERRAGVGTFVPEEQPPEVSGHLNLVLNAGHMGGESKVLSCGISPADTTTAALLSLNEGTPVIVLDRLRIVEKKPLAFSRSYLPAALFPTFEVDLSEVSKGLYRYIDQTGQPITNIHQMLEVGSADKKVSKVLGIPAGATVWILKNLSLYGTVPVEYAISSVLPYQGLTLYSTSTRAQYDAPTMDPAIFKQQWR